MFWIRLIVGIDPGTTTGLAFVSLGGRVIALSSAKDMGLKETVRALEKQGEPLILASDRMPAPSAVRKINAVFRSKIFAEQMTVDQKGRLCRPYRVANHHQRDALAAALNAYNYYSPKIRQAEKAFRDAGLGDVESAVSAVLRGEKMREIIKKQKV